MPSQAKTPTRRLIISPSSRSREFLRLCSLGILIVASRPLLDKTLGVKRIRNASKLTRMKAGACQFLHLLGISSTNLKDYNVPDRVLQIFKHVIDHQRCPMLNQV
jgi:hypothetical protein